MWPRFKSAPQRALALGYRSGLELVNADHLAKLKVLPVKYEELKVPYTIPESEHTYTPDYELPNGIIVETKGRWLADDRKKMLLVRKRHPLLDIRMVFSSSKGKIAAGSKTTNAQFADKHGIKWAEKLIPVAWCKEPGPKVKPRDALTQDAKR